MWEIQWWSLAAVTVIWPSFSFKRVSTTEDWIYLHDPLRLLQRVRPYIRKKILVDLNPRGRITIPNAMDMLKTAGFQNIAWRPFFVPETMKLPAAALRTLSVCESVPILRGLPLRWKFNVLLKGEVDFDATLDRPRVR